MTAEIYSKYTAKLIAVGGKDPNYLQVKHRLMMLRELHPQAQITTRLVHHDTAYRTGPNNRPGLAVFHALVELPDGSAGSGHGSETAQDFPDFWEKAETKAIGRALAAAGIGVQYAEDDFEYERGNPKPFVGVDSPAVGQRSTQPANARPEPTQRPTNGNGHAHAPQPPANNGHPPSKGNGYGPSERQWTFIGNLAKRQHWAMVDPNGNDIINWDRVDQEAYEIFGAVTAELPWRDVSAFIDHLKALPGPEETPFD